MVGKSGGQCEEVLTNSDEIAYCIVKLRRLYLIQLMLMKLSLLGLLLTFLCFSCQQKTADDEIKSNSEQTSNNDRNALIAELRRLQSACEKNDKEKIATFFSFPVADTALGVYFGDEPVTITREMFLKQWGEVEKQINFTELSGILKELHIDSLKYALYFI